MAVFKTVGDYLEFDEEESSIPVSDPFTATIATDLDLVFLADDWNLPPIQIAREMTSRVIK
ncbi:hypothetical protein [Aureibacillus halotolerans]|uniref:Uncharacterized protein n=1 Tax=Aureibacillus halotolerans TaxID=1508390 RepID=A0A4R6UD22_9BACI|nr:hypothetical protein [Aureibacillus halotolerans]TDQ43033.1 hypothetical protein EV213_101465 [Aureibacillus halotolerans]